MPQGADKTSLAIRMQCHYSTRSSIIFGLMAGAGAGEPGPGPPLHTTHHTLGPRQAWAACIFAAVPVPPCFHPLSCAAVPYKIFVYAIEWRWTRLFVLIFRATIRRAFWRRKTLEKSTLRTSLMSRGRLIWLYSPERICTLWPYSVLFAKTQDG